MRQAGGHGCLRGHCVRRAVENEARGQSRQRACTGGGGRSLRAHAWGVGIRRIGRGRGVWRRRRRKEQREPNGREEEQDNNAQDIQDTDGQQ